MVFRLFIYEKATHKVVTIIEGPDAISCEHEAGEEHLDEKYAWSFGQKQGPNGETGLELDLMPADKATWIPRIYEPVPDENGAVEVGHDLDGNVSWTRPKFKTTIVGGKEHHVMVAHDLEVPSDVRVVLAEQFDPMKPVGVKGGPRRMTETQIEEDAARHRERLLNLHGHGKPGRK